MKTNILTLMLWGLLSLHMQAADGETFTANTIEGVEMAFMVISETDKTVQVGTGTSGYGQCAIDYETSGSVTIPSEVTYSNVTYSVVAIGKGGFGGCEKLISIDIPNSITLIDDWAFSGCIKLETIDIPNSVTSIGARVFECCEIITSITIPSSVTSIGVNLFNGCTLLTSITVDSDNPIYDSRNHCNAIIETATNKLIAGCQSTTIPSSVTSIGNVAFRNCINLTSIEIPSSVQEIEIGAFKESGLTSIILHEGLETIASEAFAQSSLTSITIPNSVTSIGGYYTREESVTLANGKQQKVTFTYRGCFDQCENLQSVTFGTGLSSIPQQVFWYCSALESVHFNTPSNIKEIAPYAFEACNLQSIEIPHGVESIGKYAFFGNEELASIKIPSTLTSFDVTAAVPLNKIIVPSIYQWCTMDFGSSNHYGNYASPGLLCYADLYLAGDEETPVRDIIVPSGVTSLPRFIFYGASHIRSVVIPSCVESISEMSFYKCTNLQTVTLNEGLEFIGRKAFEYCDNLTNINLPNGLQTIQAAAFAFGKKLKTVIIPNSVTTAGNGDSSYAGIFQGSTGIESVTIGSGLTEIPQSMFDGCTNLQSVEFSEGLTSIGLGAFRGCTNLQSVVFPNSLTHIRSDAFMDCTSLNRIIFPNNITSVDGGYTTSGATHYPAFDGCDNLTQVIVPDFNIADWCGKNLAGGPLKYSHHIYDVNENDLLVDVVVPEGVTTIGKSVFEGCESMISLTLPSTLTSMGSYDFGYCSNLKSVTCKMTDPFSIISNYFYEVPSECVLYVPADTKDAYIVKGWTEDIFQGGIVELEEEEPSQGEDPVIEGTDMTELLVNPDFSTNDWTGWTKEAAYGGNVAVAEECAEAWNNSAFDIYQEITNVPDGLYEISVQGFYRYGRGNNAWNYYQAQEAPEVREGGAPVFVYLNNMSTPFKNVFEEPEADGFYSSQYYMSPNEQYFPDGMTSAATAFGEGMFTQRAYGLVQNGEDMRIGVKGSSNQLNDSWVIFDNFKLIYHAQNPEVVDIVLQIKSEELGDFIDNNSESMTTSVLESVTSAYNQSTNSNLNDDEKYDVLIATNNALVVAKENVQIVMAYQTALEAYQSACTSLEQYDQNQEEEIWTDINSMNDEINSSDELDNEGLSDLISRMESLTYLVLEKVAYLQNPPIEIGGIYYNLDSYTQMATVVRGNTEYEGDIVIPESVEYNDVVYAVTAIGQEAFYNCDNLTSVLIPNSVTSIGGYAFANCISLTSIDIPNSVTFIDAGAFGCTHLTSVTIPHGVTSIGHNTFSTCYLLTTVTIPGSVTFIDDYAFSLCSNLTDVYCYAEDVPETGSDIFASDEFYIVDLGNATLHVPAASIDAYQSAAPWSEFGSIVALSDEPIIADGNCIDGIYYEFNTDAQTATVISGENAYTGDVVIPESVEYNDVVYAVTAIGQEAFYDCDNLTSVVIPNSVISIGGYAFANCISMTSIDIPNSVTSIDAGAFNSTHLSSVTIPYGVTSIGHNTFSTCYLLTTVTIPGSVTYIDDYAFSLCSNLTDVYCYAEDVPETGYDIFASDEFYIVNLGNATLHVPAASIDDYQTTAPWSEFGSIVALDDEPADPGLALVNTLTIANVEVDNGHSVVLPVNLNNTESITSIQFEVALPTSNDKINVVYQSDFTEYGQDALPIGYSGVSDNSERLSTAAEPYSGGGAPRLMGSNDHVNHGIYWGARNGSNGLLQFGKYAAESATGETLGDGITEDEALWLEEGDYTLNFRNAAWDDHASPYTVRICKPNTEAIFEETDIVPDVQLAHNGNTPNEDDIPVSEYEFTVTTPGYYYIEFEGNSGWLCWLLTSLSVSAKSDVQNEDPAGITISNCQLTDRKGTNHTASYEQLVNGNYQITVSSLSDDVFSGTEGVVVNLTLDVDEDMPAGAYSVRLTNIELTTDAAQTIQPADASATLTVVNGAEEPVEPVEEGNTLVMENLSGRTGTQFLLPVGLLNEDDITALQFNLTLPTGVSIAKNSKDKYIVEKTERCEDHTLSASKPGDANVYTVLLYSNDVESITGTDGIVLNVRLEVSEDMEAGDYEVSLSNINLTTVDEVKITPADVTCTLTVTNSIPGDANGDGSIDVTDIVGIANCILGNASNSFDATAADINGDGDVDVTDIVAVANIILHSGGQNNAKMREVLDMIEDALEPQ